MPGGFIAAQKLTVTILFSLFLFSCSQLPIENNQIGDKIKKQTLKMLSQQIESTLLKSIPFDLTSVDQFTVVNKLPLLLCSNIFSLVSKKPLPLKSIHAR